MYLVNNNNEKTFSPKTMLVHFIIIIIIIAHFTLALRAHCKAGIYTIVWKTSKRQVGTYNFISIIFGVCTYSH